MNITCSIGDILQVIFTQSLDPCNQLVAQTVNLKLFESLLTTFFAKNSETVAAPTSSRTTSFSFSDDELNALRYVAGYVPYSMLKRYERNHQTKPAVLECLGNMAVAGDDSDIHNYTTKWIETVNRGGLFPINDKSFQLFIAIESIVIQTLSTSYMNTVQHNNIKTHTINTCIKNTQVQEKWTVLTKYIDFEKPDDEIKLLEEIVNLWVTIRGFSVAATWLETFKQQVKVNTKKKKSLRQSLLSE